MVVEPDPISRRAILLMHFGRFVPVVEFGAGECVAARFWFGWCAEIFGCCFEVGADGVIEATQSGLLMRRGPQGNANSIQWS